eukprot:2867137-Pyramimonas_sp.AAC.1
MTSKVSDVARTTPTLPSTATRKAMMKRMPLSYLLRGYLLNHEHLYSPNPNGWTTQQGCHVGTVWRKWRYIAASIQP